jgi:SagB-type dehydrogenase family enzyme
LLFYQNEYHALTKHSYNSVRINPNRVDWNNPPNRFKYYPKEFERISLSKKEDVFDFLYLIAGITAKKTYPGMEYYLRVNPSAGALYPNEIYFQVRNEEFLEDGIYHYEVGSSSITLLKKLEENEGIEANLECDEKYDGFIFLISSIYYRSSWKYKNRALRYCLLDAGHILGSIEASSYISDYSFKIINDFNKIELNNLFSFDEKEFFTSAVLVSFKSYKNDLQKVKLELPTIDGTSYDGKVYLYEQNKYITNAYEKSLSILNQKEQSEKSIFNYKKDFFKDVILKRRSIREFTKQSISKLQLDAILNSLYQPITSDCDEVVDIYYVINRVEDMKIGLYRNKECIKVGDFSKMAGYLCLEQDLGSSSAVTFFLVSKAVNYQEFYQKAGIIGHRLYLASNYLNIGCSGIGAYYDDEVCEFLGEQYMVLYALAIGN